MPPKTLRIASIRDLRDGPTRGHRRESECLEAPPPPPVSTTTAEDQNQQNDYDDCCRVHIITFFLRLDWKLADDGQTGPIRHFLDLLMDLLVGPPQNATSFAVLLVRVDEDHSRGHSPVTRCFPVAPNMFWDNLPLLIVYVDLLQRLGLYDLGPFLRVETRSLFQSRLI